jgi:hypothetical protein
MFSIHSRIICKMSIATSIKVSVLSFIGLAAVLGASPAQAAIIHGSISGTWEACSEWSDGCPDNVTLGDAWTADYSYDSDQFTTLYSWFASNSSDYEFMKYASLLSMNFTTGGRKTIASANNGNVFGHITLQEYDYTHTLQSGSEYSSKSKSLAFYPGEFMFWASDTQQRVAGINYRDTFASYDQNTDGSYRSVHTRFPNFQDSRDVPEPAAGLGLLALGLTTSGGAILRRRKARQIALSLGV